MRVRHKMLPRYIAKTEPNNGNPATVEGIELEVTTVTAHDDTPDTLTVRGYWMSLHEAGSLSNAIGILLIGKVL